MLNKFISWLSSLFKRPSVPPSQEIELDVVADQLPLPTIEELKESVKPAPQPRPVELWYPKAIIPKERQVTRGRYPKGYPTGAVVHYTQGWDRNYQDALNTYSWSIKSEVPMCFFLIAPGGEVIQGFPLDQWGNHAGESKSKELPSVRSVNSHYVGIEVACGGNLNSNLQASFGRQYQEKDVRRITQTSNTGGTAGIYAKFTDKQEESLKELLLWLKNNNPSVFDLNQVYGHHEVAGMSFLGRWRKIDPGGSLSLSMDKYREMLLTSLDKK